MGLLTVDGDVDAIVACVDFSDLLEVTLPWNRSRFRRLVVITTPIDESTQSIAKQNDCELILTDIFTARGAAFNRAAAIQQCLSWMQPQDWLVFLDADIMIPQTLAPLRLKIGNIYTPRRRAVRSWASGVYPEKKWGRYPYINVNEEFAGYFQLFHTSDPVLEQQPWFADHWTWCATADTIFQQRWSEKNHVRPGFDVLHLGEVGINWAGRVQPYANGEVPADAEKRRQLCEALFRAREINAGLDDRYAGEKV